MLKVMNEPNELLNIDLFCLKEFIKKVLSYLDIPGMLLSSINHALHAILLLKFSIAVESKH